MLKDKNGKPAVQEEHIVRKQMPANGFIEVFKAVKEILRNTRWEYGNALSPRIFETVRLDTGQYDKVALVGANKEQGIVFPAAFVRFINMRWEQNVVAWNQSSAELRIRIVLNRLNVDDEAEDVDTEGWYVGQRIAQEMQEHRGEYHCLSNVFYLEFFDQCEVFKLGLQEWWLTYKVKCLEENLYRERHYKKAYIVVPPFTNHADQDADMEAASGHVNLDHPRAYKDFAKYEIRKS